MEQIPTEMWKNKRRFKKIWWLVSSLLLILVIVFLVGMFHGRFNFKYEKVEIHYDNLPAGLEGFTIAHISDLHLNSFGKHKVKLIEVIDSINSYEPDMIANTGDFVTFLYTEMEPFIGTLASMKSEYGVYDIPGNHDTGLYSSDYNSDNYDEHLEIIGNMLRSSGHIYLEDTSTIINIDTLAVSITGVETYGRVPDISYGDVDEAMKGNDKPDFTIVLSHDPNHWVREIQYRKDINLTLSGHTHGMQMGILLPGFKLSPARMLSPAWTGLYGDNNNYLYVNRGLGTIGIPARVGMPPEITIITLKAKAPPPSHIAS
ncbi:MAG: metallophosphoesterase [Bacteroidota bacterium]|nr:metallophosphoesterase [Bacteroidota bacterium]